MLFFLDGVHIHVNAVVQQLVVDLKLLHESKRLGNDSNFSLIPPSPSTDPYSENTEPVRRLIESLKTTTMNDEGFIQADLLAAGSKFSKLFVREDYVRMARFILSNGTHSLVLGSPGTGKTLFCVFLAYLFIKADVPFLLNLRGGRGCYLSGTFYPLTASQFDAFKCSVFVLFADDTPPPTVFHFQPTIVFSQPDWTLYGVFRKKASTYYMPSWERHELQYLNNALTLDEGKLEESTLLTRCVFSGGIPKYIFGDWDAYLEVIERSLDDVSVDFLFTNRSNDLDEGPHPIISISVNPDTYRANSCGILSSAIATKVLNYFHSSRGKRRVELYLENLDLIMQKLLELHNWSSAPFAEDILFVKICSKDENENKIVQEYFSRKIEKKLFTNYDQVKVKLPYARMWFPKSRALSAEEFIFTIPWVHYGNPTTLIFYSHSSILSGGVVEEIRDKFGLHSRCMRVLDPIQTSP